MTNLKLKRPRQKDKDQTCRQVKKILEKHKINVRNKKCALSI